MGNSTQLLRLVMMRLALPLMLALMLLIFIFLDRPRHRKAAPYPHVGLRLGHQRVADVLLAAAHPAVEALLAERVERHVQAAAEEIRNLRTRVAHDVVQVGF